MSGALPTPDVLFSARKATNDRRIQPANFRNLPSVLDVEQAGSVLRISVERVRAYTQAGLLRRLTYTRAFLYDAREVQRFMREATESDLGAALAGTTKNGGRGA